MIQKLFFGISLLGAEWVLLVLVLLSVFSVSLMFERISFYRKAVRELEAFRSRVRTAAENSNWEDALKAAEARQKEALGDLETPLTLSLLKHRSQQGHLSPEVLSEVAQDALIRGKIQWDKNLTILATIGNNAPFVGLFGTVLGIIKAFHDLSQQSASGAASVSSGISEALVATAVGLLVAIPAVAAFNAFNRKVKSGVAHAEALKSFLIGKLSNGR